MSLETHSFISEYPRIRVDRFTEACEHIPASLRPPPRDAQGNRAPGPWDDLFSDSVDGSSLRGSQFPLPIGYLLTHPDAIWSLSGSQHNGAPIYCSKETKEMVLRLETTESRKAGAHGVFLGQGQRKRQFKWLRVSEKEAAANWKEQRRRVPLLDLLHALDLNIRHVIKYSAQMDIALTLIDANHMPGSVMFLIEGPRGAVLHMGHCRAEKWWLEALIRNPVMALYVRGHDDSDDDEADGGQRLSNIYIDDKRLAFGESLPDKTEAARDLVKLMRMFPTSVTFFFDDLTSGYEDALRAIGTSFKDGAGKERARIHVSKYKFNMYQASGNPLVDCLTTKAETTRFHACSRIDGCEHMRLDDVTQAAAEIEARESLSDPWHAPPPPSPLSKEDEESVQEALAERQANPTRAFNVVVKPIETSEQSWSELLAYFFAKLQAAKRGEAPYPSFLACPIQRHSTMPEMLNFVRTFRPDTITPRTSHPDVLFLAARYLGQALNNGGQERLVQQAKRVMGLVEWQKRMEWVNPGEGESEQRTLADELKAFRNQGRRETTSNLSQEAESQQQQSGDAGTRTTASGSRAPTSRETSARAGPSSLRNEPNEPQDESASASARASLKRTRGSGSEDGDAYGQQQASASTSGTTAKRTKLSSSGNNDEKDDDDNNVE